MTLRLLGLVLLLAVPQRLPAQRWIVLDAGAGSSRYQLGPSGSVLSLSPRLVWIGRRGYLDAGAVYTRGTTLGWNAAAQANAAALLPLSARFALDLGGEGTWTGHRHGRSTSELSLRPTLRFDGGDVRVSAGLAFGRAGLAIASESQPPPAVDSAGPSSGPVDLRYSESRGFSRGLVEGTVQAGSFDFRGRLTHTQFSRRALRAGAVWSPGVDSLFQHYVTGYDDLLIGAGWSSRMFSLAGVLEQRLGRREFRMRGWHLESSARLSGDLMLFAATGRALSRLTVDLPARSYTTAGLRWTIGAHRPAAAPAPPYAPPPARTGIRVERAGTLVRLALHVPGAAQVEVMGDFTEWEPVPLMEHADGWWVLTRVLQPGIYHLNVRYNGGPWQAPADLPTQADEFGGTVGVLLVN